MADRELVACENARKRLANQLKITRRALASAVNKQRDLCREQAELEAEVAPFFELGPVDDCIFDSDSGEYRATEQTHPRLFDAVRRAAGENAPKATGWRKAT